jgi:hypothetical protein
LAVAKDSSINADVLLRYLPLIRYLEEDGGYGKYLLIVHGRAPVKIARVDAEEKLERLGT